MPTTTITLRVRPQTGALHRVVTVCHRRSLEITALHYAEEHITLTVAGAEPRTSGITRWLGALIDVLDVSDATALGAARTPYSA
jgi:acetolactate synthase small subunit